MVVRRGGEKGNILLCTIDGVKKKEAEILVTRGKYDKREYIYIYMYMSWNKRYRDRVSRDPTTRACSAASRSTVWIPADPRHQL